MAVAGLTAILAAACRPAPLPATPAPPTIVPTAVATGTPAVAPWVLIDSALSPAVQDAVVVWSVDSGQEAKVRSLTGLEEDPPPGLWAVVGLDENLVPLDQGWSGTEVVFVVLDPSSLSASEMTSTIGPEVAYDQAGFLAGVAAGLATQSGLIGILPGAGEAGGWRMGFKEGLLYSCPKCQLESVADPGQAAFAMDVIGIPPEADVAVADPGGDAPWIVVFGEAPDGWEERVAARVRTAPEALVGPALGRLAGRAPGEAWVFATTDGGLATEVDPRAISPGRERLLREAEARLAEGRLVVGGGG
jgi:hypothetical protein